MKCCSVFMSLAGFIVVRLCIYFVDLIAFVLCASGSRWV